MNDTNKNMNITIESSHVHVAVICYVSISIYQLMIHPTQQYCDTTPSIYIIH